MNCNINLVYFVNWNWMNEDKINEIETKQINNENKSYISFNGQQHLEVISRSKYLKIFTQPFSRMEQ